LLANIQQQFLLLLYISKANIDNFDWEHWELRKLEDLRSAAKSGEMPLQRLLVKSYIRHMAYAGQHFGG